MTLTIPGYDATERTRLKLIAPGAEGGSPRLSVPAPAETWHDLEAQLVALQRAYIDQRDRSGEGASTFAQGAIYDETGQLVARVSYNGRLWDAEAWKPGQVPLLEAPAPLQQEWTNVGDVNPRQGTTLFKLADAELNDGEFRVPAIQVIAEADSGGSEKVFKLQQGELFMSKDKFAPALAGVGATLHSRKGKLWVATVGPAGEAAETPLNSREGLRILADAAIAYQGLDDIDCSALISIGLPDRMDQPRQFEGETTYYREGSSLWAIMRKELSWFMDYSSKQGASQADVIPGELLEGMPREVRSRADLLEIAAFRDLGVDSSGNPIVWRNHYAHDDCESPEAPGEAPTWQDEWSCQVDDECYCCGNSISPDESTWIGPEDPDLRSMWEDLPDQDELPSMSLDM